MTFDEWYAIYQADPATDGLAPTPRAAYEAGARETEAQLGLYGERDRSRARVGALEEALVLAAIPLEAINASVTWELSTDINAAVGTALIAIRAALANRPEGECLSSRAVFDLRDIPLDLQRQLLALRKQLAQREVELKALREALAGMMRGDGHVMGCLNSLHHRGQSLIADICDAARAALKETK